MGPACAKYDTMLSLSDKIAPINTKTKRTADIFFAAGSNVIALVVKNFLNIIPNKTGTVTIKNILEAMFRREISFTILVSINKLREVKTIKGIVITHKRLIIAVRETDRATSPFEKDVRILEVAPPGAAAIIITPTANSGDIGHNLTRIKAIIGKIIICEKAPTKKSRGCFATLRKSFPVNPKPKANIINANAKGKIISVIIPIF